MAMPLPLNFEQTQLEELFLGPSSVPLPSASWNASLTPNLAFKEEQHPSMKPLAESVVLRGTPEWALKQSRPRGPGDYSTSPLQLLASYLQKYTCNRRF